MNQIAQALRRQGYKGALSDPNAVRAFITTECPMEFTDQDGKTLTTDQAVEYAAKKVTISVAADAGEEVEVSGAKAGGMDDEAPEGEEPMPKSAPKPKAKAKTIESVIVAPFVGFSPQASARRAEAKAYNRKAAEGKAAFSDADTAEAFRAWFKTTAFRNFDYSGKSLDREIVSKAQISTTFTAGGALVPDEFLPDLVRLREIYNVADGLAREVKMSNGTISLPRRTGGLTVYAPGEGGAITASEASYDTYNINAVKRAVLAEYSSELLNDGDISIADELANEIVYAFEKNIAECLIKGDGTTTYQGAIGYQQAILGLSATRANIAGAVVGTGNLYSELAIADFQKVAGRLPDFDSISGEPSWYVNKRFYYEVMVRIALAVGGVTAAEVNGKMVPMFLGSPVKFVRSMPRTEANDQVCALYGWGYEAASIGRVNGSMEIATSADFNFDNDLFTVRGIHRAGVTVHSVGNASGTESAREPGPIVALLTAAS
jgi:HK97 family phage major capsid protein